MDYQYLNLVADQQIARITLNRPTRMNCLSIELKEELCAAIASVADSDARVLILTGNGRGFCAGADLASVTTPDMQDDPPDLQMIILKYYQPLVLGLRALPIPVIAAVNGVAAGAGASLALACDIVLATRSASFLQAFTRIGLAPDAGSTWFLPRLVGNARALGLAMLAEPVSAQQAADWGMIWKCVDDDQFAGEVDALAKRLACAPTRALAATKHAIWASAEHSLGQQIAVEAALQGALGRTADFAEGVAAFLQKRPAVFTGK